MANYYPIIYNPNANQLQEIASGSNIDLTGNDIVAIDSINATGIVTANQFVGDGSGLTGVVATGSGVVIQEEGSPVGTAATINFVGVAVTATLADGVATVEISSGGGGSAGVSETLALAYSVAL